MAASTSGVHAGDDLGDRATPLSGTQLHPEPTKAYVPRRIVEGKTKPEVIRCLKWLLAHELWAAMRPLRETLKDL